MIDDDVVISFVVASVLKFGTITDNNHLMNGVSSISGVL